MPIQEPKPIAASTTKPAKPSKYRNKKVEIEGEKYDSQKEARRHAELKTLEAAGEIKNLSRQFTLSIEHDGVKICRYVADFVYELPDGERIVEDVKSPITRKNPVYRLKKKLIRAFYEIDILET